MRIRIDTHSGEPIWRQIVEQVKFAVASGDLEPGGQLPSIRALASQLKINPRTVVKAYEKLRSLDLVVMRQGQGVFVNDERRDAPAATRRKVLTDMARRLMAEASRLGGSPDEVRDIFDKIAEEMEADDDA